MESQVRKAVPSVLSLIVVWAIYSILYSALKTRIETRWLAELLGVVGESVLSVVLAALAIWLWRTAANNSKHIFGFLALAFSLVATTSITYNLMWSVHHINIPYFSVNNNLGIIHNLPYVLCLSLEFLCWFSIVFQMNKKFSNAFRYIPVPVIAIAISALFFFVFKSKIGQLEMVYGSVYSATVASFCFVNFALALLCFVASRNFGIVCLALGYMLGVLTDLLANFGAFQYSFAAKSLVETVWVLALALMFTGLLAFKRTAVHRKHPTNWVAGEVTLQAQA